MRTLLKSFVLGTALTLSGIASAQNSEYIVKKVEGSVEYRPKSTSEWQPVKRLQTIMKSSLINIADNGSLTIYSLGNPQILKIDKQGENRLRQLITEAEKKANEARKTKLVDIVKGHEEGKAQLFSGVSDRGMEGMSWLSTFAEAVKTASISGKASIGITLVKDSEGDYGVELKNDSGSALVFAVIIDIDGQYSALRISDDHATPSAIVIPSGASLTLPECSIADIEGMEVIAVAARKYFNPATLCVVLNSPADLEKSDGSNNNSVVAVKATTR